MVFAAVRPFVISRSVRSSLRRCVLHRFCLVCAQMRWEALVVNNGTGPNACRYPQPCRLFHSFPVSTLWAACLPRQVPRAADAPRPQLPRVPGPALHRQRVHRRARSVRAVLVLLRRAHPCSVAPLTCSTCSQLFSSIASFSRIPVPCRYPRSVTLPLGTHAHRCRMLPLDLVNLTKVDSAVDAAGGATSLQPTDQERARGLNQPQW